MGLFSKKTVKKFGKGVKKYTTKAGKVAGKEIGRNLDMAASLVEKNPQLAELALNPMALTTISGGEDATKAIAKSETLSDIVTAAALSPLAMTGLTPTTIFAADALDINKSDALEMFGNISEQVQTSSGDIAKELGRTEDWFGEKGAEIIRAFKNPGDIPDNIADAVKTAGKDVKNIFDGDGGGDTGLGGGDGDGDGTTTTDDPFSDTPDTPEEMDLAADDEAARNRRRRLLAGLTPGNVTGLASFS